MPPIRSQNAQNSVKHIQNHPFVSQSEVAEIFDIPRSTLARRPRGTLFRGDIRPTDHKLTQLEEDLLAKGILFMDSRGAAPRHFTVREIAHILPTARGLTPPLTVGLSWTSTSSTVAMSFVYASRDDAITSVR